MTKYDRVQEGLVRIELPADGENSKQFPILDIYTDTRCSLEEPETRPSGTLHGSCMSTLRTCELS